MIEIHKNFIDDALINLIERDVQIKMKNNVWAISNISWPFNLTLSSMPIITLLLSDEINETIKKIYIKKFPQFKNKGKWLINFTIWSPCSYLPWHDDNGSLMGSTIYLSKNYDKNDGGLFLYKDYDNRIRAIEPEYKMMLLNSRKNKKDILNEHAVSMISNQPKFRRETIQVFVR